MVICKICQVEFSLESIQKHLVQSSKCVTAYPKESYQQILSKCEERRSVIKAKNKEEYYLAKIYEEKQLKDKRALMRSLRRADAMSVFCNLRGILLPKVQSNLEIYSAWIPKYKLTITQIITSYEGKNSKKKLVDLEKSIDATYKDCQEKVQEIITRFSEGGSLASFNNENIIKGLDEIMYQTKMVMERCEVLLRLDLWEANQQLKNFGYFPTCTKEEKELKFGSHPDYEFVGNGVEKHLRGDEIDQPNLLYERVGKDTVKCLLEWLKDEYTLIDLKIYEKMVSEN